MALHFELKDREELAMFQSGGIVKKIRLGVVYVGGHIMLPSGLGAEMPSSQNRG